MFSVFTFFLVNLFIFRIFPENLDYKIPNNTKYSSRLKLGLEVQRLMVRNDK